MRGLSDSTANMARTTNRKWLGDSIGRWEGDTLVVETKNFKEKTGLYGGDENLQLTERFTGWMTAICFTTLPSMIRLRGQSP